jgi:hypothetical protein
MTKDFLVNLIHFSITPKDDPKQALEIKKRARGKEYARRSLADFADWMEAERCLPPLKVRLAALD